MLTLEEYEKLNPRCELTNDGVSVSYCTPTTHTKWRVDSLFEKEPCTIAWIAGFGRGDVLVDVGANVGMYTIWAAKTRGTRVFAFEPEAQNCDVNTWQFYDEALLVQDYTTYSLGPHTDNTIKVLSFLFYLPSDDSHAHLGTSIYVPKDPNFTCQGGPHHPFEWFNRMHTMPYLPNTLFAFLKTHNSFHGVEPITDPEVRRDLLLYDIRVSSPSGPAQQPSAETPGAATPVKFSF